MAATSDISPTTSATVSTPIICNGINALTLGIYVSGGGQIEETVGARVMIADPDGDREATDSRGRPLILTDLYPRISIKQTGAYYIDKPATTTAVGIWSDASSGVAAISAVQFVGDAEGAYCDTVLGGIGATNFEVQALVYIDGAYLSEDRIFMLQYPAGRQAGLFVSNLFPAVRLVTGDSQVGSTGGTIDGLADATGKWCLMTFSGDNTVAPLGLWQGSIESLDGSISYTEGGRTKGVEDSLTAERVDLNGAGGENGWDNGIRFAEVRGYNAQRTSVQRQADLTNTDPTGAAFWWSFSEAKGGGIAVSDLTDNGILPTLVGGTLVAGPTL